MRRIIQEVSDHSLLDTESIGFVVKVIVELCRGRQAASYFLLTA